MGIDDPDSVGAYRVPRSRVRPPLSLLLCGALLYAGCALNLGGESAEKMRSIAHPNGLALVVPESLIVSEGEKGFVITSPMPDDDGGEQKVTVRLRDKSWDITAEYLQTTRVGGRTVYYRIDEEHGPSGNGEYRLTAWVPVGDLHVELSQVEPNPWPGLPDFKLTWIIITGIITKEREPLRDPEQR